MNSLSNPRGFAIIIFQEHLNISIKHMNNYTIKITYKQQMRVKEWEFRCPKYQGKQVDPLGWVFPQPQEVIVSMKG